MLWPLTAANLKIFPAGAQNFSPSLQHTTNIHHLFGQHPHCEIPSANASLSHSCEREPSRILCSSPCATSAPCRLATCHGPDLHPTAFGWRHKGEDAIGADAFPRASCCQIQVRLFRNSSFRWLLPFEACALGLMEVQPLGRNKAAASSILRWLQSQMSPKYGNFSDPWQLHG